MVDFVNDWLAAWTGNQPERLIGFYTEDVYYRDPARPDGLFGRDPLLDYFRRLLRKNPDWVWQAVEVRPFEGGFLLKWQATIPRENAPAAVTEGLDLVEIKHGLISRNEVFFDTQALQVKSGV